MYFYLIYIVRSKVEGGQEIYRQNVCKSGRLVVQGYLSIYYDVIYGFYSLSAEFNSALQQ